MNDLISRSALLEQVKAIHRAVDTSEVNLSYDTGFHSATSQIQGLIASMPAVDAVPVVRCGECRRRYDADECPMCFLIDGEYHEYTNGNGYCDRGERRNGDG